MRKKIAAGNWKMNTTPEEGKNLITEIIKGSPKLNDSQEVIFFPPFTHISAITEAVVQHNFKTGAQNCSQHEKGAYTGEISTGMLTAIKATHVIIGHSERRSIFGENYETLKEKSSAVLKAGLTLVFCCGETIEEREANKHFSIIEEQMAGSIQHLSSADMKNVIIAYEPVWAIGTGKTASPGQAQEMHAHIRALLAKYFDDVTAQNTSILYGGSVNAANANELFSMADIDGGLVGGASLKAAEFIEIIKALP